MLLILFSIFEEVLLILVFIAGLEVSPPELPEQLPELPLVPAETTLEVFSDEVTELLFGFEGADDEKELL